MGHMGHPLSKKWRSTRPRSQTLCTNHSPASGADPNPQMLHVFYDLKENEAWVSVGVSHDTGEFADP